MRFDDDRRVQHTAAAVGRRRGPHRHQSSRLIESIIIKDDTFDRTGFGY